MQIAIIKACLSHANDKMQIVSNLIDKHHHPSKKIREEKRACHLLFPLSLDSMITELTPKLGDIF